MGSYYSGMMNNEFGYGELRHHGILGQKWGVRRFQNKDGSLTADGRKRYNKSEEEHYRKVRHWDKDTAYTKAKNLPENDEEERGKNNVSLISKAHSKITRDMKGGGTNSEIYDSIMRKAKSNKDKDRIKKNRSDMIDIVANAVQDKELVNAEAKMNDFYEKNMSGLFTSKKNKEEYSRLRENYRSLNSKAFYKMSNDLSDYISKLPKDEQDAWMAIAYIYLGLDW